MAIDEQIESLLKKYNQITSSRGAFLRDPSPDNYEPRMQIADPNGRAMLSQPAGIVAGQIQDNLNDVVSQLSPSMTGEMFSSLKNEYKLINGYERELYVELARQEFLPEDASDKLKEISNKANIAHTINEYVARGKYDDAVNLLSRIGVGELKAELAYQYHAIGQNMNVGAIAKRYASMLKRDAMASVDDSIKAEVDKAIGLSNSTRAQAAAEVYKLYSAQKKQEEAEKESKEAIEKAKKKAKKE